MLKAAARSTMSKTLQHAKITPYRSANRGHSNHGWLDSYHTFAFSDWFDARFVNYGALRVLNEDRVQPGTGFPTHRHRDFEIFSYILSGELTHRDSMLASRSKSKSALSSEDDKDLFYRMRRGDMQFTTGGTGIAHSEFNEHAADPVHFLQIWATPWRTGLTPRYHTRSFDEGAKRRGFVALLSPLRAGPDATAEQEREAVPTLPDTIPVHADLVMGAAIIEPGRAFEWDVGGGVGDAGTAEERKVFVHLPMTKGGQARVRLDGRDGEEDAVLEEGDGAFVDLLAKGDRLRVESVGEAEAEVVVLDTA